MKTKIKVLVLMGGKSSEHEVSVLSGINVIKNLDPKRYDALPIVISKDGSRWKLTNQSALVLLKDALKYKGSGSELILSSEKEISGVNSLARKNLDVVFIAMHGLFGEDGTIQGMLELSGIPYTGSGVLASALGMDKIMFRKVMESEKITIPKYVLISRGDNFKKVFKYLKNPPFFVKPSNQGSSVGATLVKHKKDLGKAIKLAHKYSNVAIVDQYIKGLEVTCTVMGNNNPFALPVVEILPLKGDFFDYKSKYTESGSEEIVPARISKITTKKVQELAVKVYKVIGCRGFGRVDFILEKRVRPVVLEINTIPGLTTASLAPKAAKAAGMSYSKFLDKIIAYATEKI